MHGIVECVLNRTDAPALVCAYLPAREELA